MTIAGVDIETTGTDPDKGHRLIQIGIAFPNDELCIVYDVQPRGDISISAEALNINKFTIDRIAAAPYTSYIDTVVSEELRKAGHSAGSINPVGWNVGSFDMRFIRKEMPLTAAFFHYRCIDLTSLVLYYNYKYGTNIKVIKDTIKTRAVECLHCDKEHDALWDARASLIALTVLKKEYL